MNTFSNSTSMIVAVASAADASALIDALGRGADTFSLGLAPAGSTDATHLGAHTFDDELAGIIASRALPNGLDLASKGLTAETAQAALSAIAIYSVLFNPETDSALANFTAFSSSLGLVRI